GKQEISLNFHPFLSPSCTTVAIQGTTQPQNSANRSKSLHLGSQLTQFYHIQVSYKKVNTMYTHGHKVERVQMKDSTTNNDYGNIANFKGEPDVGESEIEATAGIGNYGSKHSHRHFLEEEADKVRDVMKEIEIVAKAGAGIETKNRAQQRHFFEVRDVTDEETTADSEGKVNIDEVEITDAEAALMEKEVLEDCEGVLSTRRHFPGTTTSHIFG
ncbi:unnamed protein product, partial [Larinioides sclopetarius]